MSLQIQAIEDYLRKDKIDIDYIRLVDKHDGLMIKDGPSSYIAIAPDLTSRQQLSVLAHEAGHHFTGLTKHKGRNEERANRWAALELLKPVDIINATISGCQSYHELAEMLDLDEDFIKISLQCFRRMYGAGIEIDGYYLHLYPIWVKELKTGRIWPEE